MDNKMKSVVKWYNAQKGYGILESGTDIILLHKEYLIDKTLEITAGTIIEFTPVRKDKIIHATNASITKDIDIEYNKTIKSEK